MLRPGKPPAACAEAHALNAATCHGNAVTRRGREKNMSCADTQVFFGAPRLNHITLTGRVTASPVPGVTPGTPHPNQTQRDAVTIVHLHLCDQGPAPAQVPPPCPSRRPFTTGAAIPEKAPDAKWTKPTPTVPILVRGGMAHWCDTLLPAGALIYVEASLCVLDGTPDGVCLSYLEAGSIRLLDKQSPVLPAQAAAPSGTPPHACPINRHLRLRLQETISPAHVLHALCSLPCPSTRYAH